jgi:hypothetical protein
MRCDAMRCDAMRCDAMLFSLLYCVYKRFLLLLPLLYYLLYCSTVLYSILHVCACCVLFFFFRFCVFFYKSTRFVFVLCRAVALSRCLSRFVPSIELRRFLLPSHSTSSSSSFIHHSFTPPKLAKLLPLSL